MRTVGKCLGPDQGGIMQHIFFTMLLILIVPIQMTLTSLTLIKFVFAQIVMLATKLDTFKRSELDPWLLLLLHPILWTLCNVGYFLAQAISFWPIFYYRLLIPKWMLNSGCIVQP